MQSSNRDIFSPFLLLSAGTAGSGAGAAAGGSGAGAAAVVGAGGGVLPVAEAGRGESDWEGGSGGAEFPRDKVRADGMLCDVYAMLCDVV